MFGLVRLFSPPVPSRFFFPAFCEFFCPAPGFTGLLLPVRGFLFTFYPLDFFARFIYSLASITAQFFVDGIMMSSFFTPRGAPHHSDTPRHPASTRALSLSLLLGLSPLAGITPAALATPTQTASDQPTQVAPAQADSEQATPASPAPFESLPPLQLRASRPIRYRLCASLAEH